LRGKRQEKERAHVTTDNQDATHMEAKATSHTDALQYPLSRAVFILSTDSVCLTNSVRLVTFESVKVEYTDAPQAAPELSTGDKMPCPYCGHLLPRNAERCDRCDWVRGATQTAEGKASDAVAVMFSIIPGLGHIYKGHIFAGLALDDWRDPGRYFCFPCCVRLCRVGTRPVFLLSCRGDATCLRDRRSGRAAERGRRRGVLSAPKLEALHHYIVNCNRESIHESRLKAWPLLRIRCSSNYELVAIAA
jgi:hypothetical protein